MRITMPTVETPAIEPKTPTSGSRLQSASTASTTAAVAVCTSEEKDGAWCFGCVIPSRAGSTPLLARVNWYLEMTLWNDSTHANRLEISSTLMTSLNAPPTYRLAVSSIMLPSPARVCCATSTAFVAPAPVTSAQQETA
jgi:hypothetical protein